MVRYLRLTLLLLLLLSAICSCKDDPTILSPNSDNGDVTERLALEVYKCGTDFNDIGAYMDGPPTVVGDGGIILAWSTQSSRFIPVASGVANNLIHLRMDEDDSYFYGEGLSPSDPSILLKYFYNSGNWYISDIPAVGQVTDCRDDYAVTTAGEVVHLQTGGGLIFEEPGGHSLNGVAHSDRQLLVVGEAGVMWIGTQAPGVADWVDADWVDHTVALGPDFNDAQRTYDPVALEYNFYAVGGSEVWVQRGGGSWAREYHGLPGELMAIANSGSDGVLAVGTNGLVVTGDAGSWDQHSVGADVTFRGLDVWFDAYACGDNGTLYCREGGVWTDLGFANISPWNDIHGIAADEAYAANGDTLMFWNGTDWRSLATHFAGIISLHAVSSDRIWVVSRSADGWDNFVNVWTGNMFNSGFHSSIDALNSVWCDAAGDTVLVAASNGYVFRLGGPSWEWLTADASRRNLYDLDGTSAHDIYAVGEDGLIVHFNGTSWKEFSSGVTNTLRAISGGIAVGDNGTITRYNGSQWIVERSGTMANLNAVWNVDGKEAWAVGDNGVILSRDSGGKWTVYERSLFTIDMKSVWGYNSSDIWIGGETGYLVRHQP